MKRLLPAGLTVILVCSCAADLEPTVFATRADSAGIEIVSNNGGDRLLAWSFEPILRIGGGDSGPDAFFRVPPAGVALDSNSIYVLDSGRRRVDVFHRTGAHVRTIGRQGSGPGEFRFPSSLAVDSLGAVMVHDVGNRALIRFNAAGEYVGQDPAPAATVGSVRSRNSDLLYATRVIDPDRELSTFTLHLVAAEDTSRLAGVTLPADKSLFYESCGVSISLPPLFVNQPSWDVRNGYVAISHWPEYEIRLIADGGNQRVVRRPIAPERATAEHANAELGEGEEWLIGDTPCTVPTAEVLEKRGIATHVPVLTRVTLGVSGEIWAERKITGPDRGPIDVFDSTGEYVGTLPPGSPWPIAFVSDHEIAALEMDEWDVPSIVVYRVDR